MAFKRISKYMGTKQGAMVYAEGDHDANTYRVVCSDCPGLKNKPRNSQAGAILAAADHADRDACLTR